MAKKKLLYVLVLSLLVTPLIGVMVSKAGDIAEIRNDEVISKNNEVLPFIFNQEDMSFTNKLAKSTKQFSIAAIKEKWLELQKIQTGSFSNINEEENLSVTMQNNFKEKNNSLRVFVSTSMPLELLKRYAQEASFYKAILVFNGLPDGSWLKLSDLVYEMNKSIRNGNKQNDDATHNIEIQIDNEAFTEYGITSVPTFVLSSQNNIFENRQEELSQSENTIFDKVTGNIGIKRALEQIEAEGNLSEIAGQFLYKEQRQ